MKVNKKIAISIALASGFAVNTATFAQEGVVANEATSTIVKQETVIEKVAVSAPLLQKSNNPNIMWDRFLSSHGLKEGWNKLPSGSVYITKGEATVGKNTSDRQFIASRNIAFEKAIVFAQESMSSELSTTASFKTLFSISDVSGNLPPDLSNAKNEISIFDKIGKLTNEALDEQIRKYDPSWSSAGKTQEEINAKVVETRESFEQTMTDKTSLWLQGSSVIFNTEGPDSEGMYSVVTGLAWSPAYSKLVNNLIDHTQPAPIGKPNKAIIDQINKKLVNDPKWLAKQLGIRVMRDEEGRRVLVGFYVTAKQGNKYRYQRSVMTAAKKHFASFVSSKLAASTLLRQAETQDFNSDDTITAYNQSSFDAKIKVVGKEVSFNGLGSIKTWEGRHPSINNQKIYGVVMRWSPASRDLANSVIKQNEETRKIQYNKTHGGSDTKTSVESVGPQAVTGFGSGAFSIDDF